MLGSKLQLWRFITIASNTAFQLIVQATYANELADQDVWKAADDKGKSNESLKHDVVCEECASTRDRPSEQRHNGAWVIGDVLGHSNEACSNERSQEHIEDLKVEQLCQGTAHDLAMGWQTFH
eukprot:TRINITY_DN12454_c0_g3_i10.p4 TRINITY_DN12454_c0_g3~~TRINITY_DN12454_c0_g3_i10.p4  ORF type:complete len:123 (-),score=17.35 TRINITY_DN12454_c0_g3_i10:1830-2198(-)